MLDDAILALVNAYPRIGKYLSPRARLYVSMLALKSEEDFLARLNNLVKAVYKGTLGGGFIDAMAALVARQITLAFREAWKDEGSGGAMPESLVAASEDMILRQYDFVDGYYKDIVTAREDKAPIDPLLTRATQWAGQYDTAYREGLQIIRTESGGNLIWQHGKTEKGCQVCADLSGIVMSAREWEELGVHPRGYPNDKLGCRGGGPANNCDCELLPTNKRRSPDAYNSVMNIIVANKL